ncbi:MAG: nitroreductase family protein [Deltaproteobacteria bacterium]|nr:nitroreductase family protein [Deltaproteobacteria bacterium]
MNLIEIISTRRSIRKYEDRQISEAVLTQVLEAVRWAPSWANTQCWEIVIIRDMEIRKQLQATLPPKGNPAHGAMVQAPVLLGLCGKLNISGFYKGQMTTQLGDWYMFDLGLAAQTLCLAAHESGLGTVIVGAFDHNRAQKILKVPEDYQLLAFIPIGYPAKKSAAPKRKTIEAFTRNDTF